MAKRGLGTNLMGLFDDDVISGAGDNAVSTTATILKVSDIEPYKKQPRSCFGDEKMRTLADSIALKGVIQPIVVRPYKDAYQIIAGERRWRAARMAGLDAVPVRVIELSDSEMMQYALIENLQREDLNPIEEANGYYELIEKQGIRHEDVAKIVGKNRSSITNSLRLLSLPEEIKKLVEKGELSKGHCKALLGLSDAARMVQIAKKVIAADMSVHALEKLIKAENTPKLAADKPSVSVRMKPLYSEAQLSLSGSIGKTVRINEGKAGKVTIEIDVFSDEELMEVVNRLGAN